MKKPMVEIDDKELEALKFKIETLSTENEKLKSGSSNEDDTKNEPSKLDALLAALTKDKNKTDPKPDPKDDVINSLVTDAKDRLLDGFNKEDKEKFAAVINDMDLPTAKNTIAAIRGLVVVKPGAGLPIGSTGGKPKPTYYDPNYEWKPIDNRVKK